MALDRRRSSWATRRAACSRRSCSTTASARPAWRSTRRPPRASSACRCRRSGRRFPVLEEPGQPRTRGRLHARAVALRVHQHASARRSRDALYERYHIPASGAIFWGSALGEHPPRQRRQLGGLQERRPRAAAVHLRAARTTSCRRRHPAVERQALQVEHGHRGQGVRGRRTCCRRGRAGRRSPTTRSTGRRSTRTPGASRAAAVVKGGVRLTHIGGPTVLIEVGGWRLLTDPTFDPPGRQLPVRLGDVVAQARRARRSPPADLGPIDAVLLTHDHHDDNLDAAGRALLPSRRRGRDHRRRARGGSAASARGLAPWADARARGARPAGDRDHGDAVPPRAAAQPPDRRRRDRLRAALGGPGARRRCGSPATRCSTTGCARSPERLAVDTALLHLGGVRFPVTGPLRYTMTARDAVELLRPGAPAHRDPDPLRGLDALPRGPRRRSSASSRARRTRSARASAGCRSASRSSSRTAPA